ncbi:CDP-glycerol glycerophosphotransferase family protein [Congregibacter litoralis]|uniref:Putative glycosyl/glycerophosphate transferase n=1 Tax=Congregibacter litoralis KT71 TaxID=314285 RepID=A4A559_9GAMM|nr:CDP-glycerol glycerophosphotransferase family protein [Congregibacter litoralis]EAQ98930.1 putative glycosyl/glycerophosphate transferase [Congregibacter litoralis KT71]
MAKEHFKNFLSWLNWLIDLVLIRLRAILGLKENIVFYSDQDYHLIHLAPVVKSLSLLRKARITIICSQQFDTSQFPNIRCIVGSAYTWKKPLAINLLISSELIEVPKYLAGKSVYFGHGIGPKINHLYSEMLGGFDYVYCPCKYFYQKLSTDMPGLRLREIGLPVLDVKPKPEERKYLLYAPSWNIDETLISDYNSVLTLLSELEGHEVIVSLHPLLARDIARGKLPKLISFSDTPFMKMITDTDFSSSFEVLLESKLVIGDISSLLFEALAFDIPIVFDGNETVYVECKATDILYDLREATYPLTEICTDDLIRIAIQEDPRRAQRSKLARRYLSNDGFASTVFCDEVCKLLDKT